MSEDDHTMQYRMRKEGEGRDEKYIYDPVTIPMLPVDQEHSDKVDEMMAEKTKGTNRRSFKALEEENAQLKARLALYDKYLGDTMQKTENAELRAEIERLKGGNDFGGHG